MSNPRPFRAGSFEERLQASVEAYEAAPNTPARREPDAAVIDLGQLSPQPAIDEVDRQVKVLRNQLKGALQEVDRRLELAAARIEQAERTAAEATARAAEAVTALRELEVVLRSGRAAHGAHAADSGDNRQRLREALEQLKSRSVTSG